MLRYYLLLGFLVPTLATLFCQSGSDSIFASFLAETAIALNRSSSGLAYHIQTSGHGVTPTNGDYVLIRFAAELPDGTVFDRTTTVPFVFQVGNREVIKGLDEGVRFLRPGGKAILYVPASLGYGSFGIADIVPPDCFLIYRLELVEILDFQAYDRYMREMEEMERQAFEARKREQSEADHAQISRWAASRQLSIRWTSNGLAYHISKPGSGRQARLGDNLVVRYQGFLSDDTAFDSPAQPFEFVLGRANIIPGWEEGIPLFREGGEGWLLIPSELAYGPVSVGKIPANAVLFFKISLLKIN
ncbi:MAG: hypothetical protein RLY31_2600 [Bacteroidota bacterium]|jgi:FKBP-type peptidyl-prolyl cis-trans isomerase